MSLKSAQTSEVKIWSRSFFFVLMANALLFMAFEMLLPTLPLFVASIGGQAQQIGLVTGIFVFSAVLIRPFAGVLAARWDKKYLLVIGILICGLSTGAYYLSTDISLMLAIRIIHGFGFGLATTYFTTIAAENIPKERRGEGIGYFGVGETIAMSVGPLLGVAVLQASHFKSLFITAMVITLIALLKALFISKKQVVTDDISEAKAAKVPIKLLEKRVLFPSILVMMTGISAGGVMSFTALYAVDKGFENIAWFFFVVAISGFLVRLVSGKMFDKLGAGSVLVPFALITIVGFIMLTLAQNEFQFLVAGFLYGFGFGAIFPALQTMCLNLVEEHEHENAIATFFNLFDLGIGGGALLLGFIAEVFSYQAVYVVSIIAYVIYLCFYFVFTRKTSF